MNDPRLGMGRFSHFSIPMQSMLCTWNVDRRSLDCNKADISIDVPVSSVVIIVVMVCRRLLA